MSTQAITFKVGKCLLLVGVIPFMFACTKSKFSAVKTPPATNQTQTVQQPTPDVPYNDNTDHNDPNHICKPGCDHPCKPPPVVCQYGNDPHGSGCLPPPQQCPAGYNSDGHGGCVQIQQQCPAGYTTDGHGGCKKIQQPCPLPPPQNHCDYGTDSNGNCLPKPHPDCQYGYDNHTNHCKPCPLPPPPHCDYGTDTHGNCLPKPQPTCPQGTYMQENGKCSQPPPPLCYDYDYNIPEYTGPQALNVWIVMDGSKSNSPERNSEIHALIDMYQSNIARQMPITISVIAGHSKQSPASVLSGNLFFQHGSEPAVLRFDPSMSKAQRQKAVNDLDLKIQGMQTDNSNGVSDGGELLVANLFAALSPSNLARAEQMGAFGHGNLLNVHFIGDENDICHPGQVEDYDKITVNGKTMSREKYAYEKYCVTVKDFDGKTYTLAPNAQGFSQALYDRLAAINQSGAAQVHLTGFLYTGDHPVPSEGFHNENEIGHGMVELIQAMNGKAYDLAALKTQSDKEIAATTLMNYINASSGMSVKFKVSNKNIQYNNIDMNNTYVNVDKTKVNYTIDKDKQSFQLNNCPLNGRKAHVHVCNNAPPKSY